MPITHSKVSGKVDSADTSLVRPTDWNAGHVVDVDLTTEVSGVLPIANGGTGASSLTGGDGITYSTGTISADINTTNLKFTDNAGDNEINTIQDIDTTSSPTFATVTATGNMSAADPVADQNVVTKAYLEANQYITVTQNFSAQTSVTVTHNNGYYTHPIAVISNDEYIPFTVTQTSINAFTVTFSSAQTGFLFYPTTGVSSGSAAEPSYVIVSANYPILADDDYIEADTAGITTTLPTAVGVTGKEYSIDNSSNGDITADTTSSQTINGLTSQIIPPDSNMKVVSNGVNWRIK